MSEWTSLRDILHDLSVAQGCMVPACLETYDDRPPILNIPEEECEEQFYVESGGGGDIASPDCELIQQMLDMVKEKKNSKEEDQIESDLSPLSPEFVPKKEQDKIKRNVALSSIITTQKKELASRRPIPNDVVPTMFKRKNTSPKVYSESASPSQMSSPEKTNQYTPTSLANDYYSKYLEKNQLKEQFEEDIWLRADHEINKIEDRRKKKADVGSPQKIDNNEYTPSSLANEYYSKYLQKSRLKEQFEEDIWTRAERQMKEIEARKKRGAQGSKSQTVREINTVASLARGFDIVNLPEHRHVLSENCVVCSVASKHGYEF